MSAIVTHFRWVMLVSGVLTFTMIHAAIAPEAALTSTFGESLTGPLANIVVRSWGTLIALVGLMLIYGAFHPPVRALVLVVAGVSKAIFVGLVLSQGERYLARSGRRSRHRRLGHGRAVRVVSAGGDTQSGHSTVTVPGGQSRRPGSAILEQSASASGDELRDGCRFSERCCAVEYAEMQHFGR